jgi:ATP-binding cassette subfamily F protein uup
MNYLSIEKVAKGFGDKVLFKDISFGMDQGDKMAIVAKNGSGKSTLLKCMMGKDTFDEGQVVFRNDIRIGYLEQTEDLDPEQSILDTILSADLPAFQVYKDYQKALASGDNKRIENLMNLMSELEAWNIDADVHQILGVLKLDDPDKQIKHLSGGQKKRVALAQVLLSEADFLILDEPTNHLDLDMIEWLEDYLSKARCTLLMVTHDRYFLEVVCNHILELDDEGLYKYKGNFSYYLEKKAEREEQLASTIEKAKNTFKKELDWIRRQPKARGVKQKARVDNFQVIKDVATQNTHEDELEIPIKMERLGTKIIEMTKVSMAYDELTILDKFSYHFKRQERLGIVGKNGAGKSTFLDIMMGLSEPDAGKIVLGETVKFGYYSQSLLDVPDDKKVIDVIRDIAEFIPLEKGRQMGAPQLLEKFLFPRHMHYQFVYKLSGGEKRRLKLLTVLMGNPNFLVLDEPTNDLDIFVLAVLEDYLRTFKGCLVVVSHDRYFMDKLVDHLFVFEGDGKIKDILGNYTVYREKLKDNVQAERDESAANLKVEKAEKLKVEKAEKAEASKPAVSEKITFKEKMELEDLDGELEKLEKEKDKWTLVLSGGSASSEELIEAGKKLKDIVDQIDYKSERWLILSEKS